MTAVLQRMRWWHIEQLLPIERQLFQPEPWTAHHFWSELGQVDTRHYLVAIDANVLPGGPESGSGGRTQGGVVGYAGLCAYPDEAFVQTMAVAPQVQRLGLGALLLEALLAEAARRGQSRVLLEVRADNEAAQRLYTRYGFARSAVRRGYYPGGVDAWVMERSGSA